MNERIFELTTDQEVLEALWEFYRIMTGADLQNEYLHETFMCDDADVHAALYVTCEGLAIADAKRQQAQGGGDEGVA